MQGKRGAAITVVMIRSLVIAALVAAAPSLALADGPIHTVTRGPYVCELPGDADVGPGKPQVDEHFTVESGSRYSTVKGGGTYLRRGNLVVITSGPRKGEKYQVVHAGFLRLMDAQGQPTRLRCVLKWQERES